MLTRSLIGIKKRKGLGLKVDEAPMVRFYWIACKHERNWRTWQKDRNPSGLSKTCWVLIHGLFGVLPIGLMVSAWFIYTVIGQWLTVIPKDKPSQQRQAIKCLIIMHCQQQCSAIMHILKFCFNHVCLHLVAQGLDECESLGCLRQGMIELMGPPLCRQLGFSLLGSEGVTSPLQKWRSTAIQTRTVQTPGFN